MAGKGLRKQREIGIWLFVLGALALPALMKVVGKKLPSSQFQPGHEMTVISREFGSGTRSAFTKLFDVRKKAGDGYMDGITDGAMIVNKNGIMLTAIQVDVHAIGYASMSFLPEGVKAVAVDGVCPGKWEILSGDYPYVRPFYLAVRKGDKEAMEFLRYALGREGQAMMESCGYLAVHEEGEEYVPVSGIEKKKLVIAGSSSVAPAVQALQDGFAKACGPLETELQQCDTSTGIALLQKGNADIAMLSREPTKEEWQELILVSIALDGIVIVVNEKNPAVSMKKEEIRKVFVGEVQVWD